MNVSHSVLHVTAGEKKGMHSITLPQVLVFRA